MRADKILFATQLNHIMYHQLLIIAVKPHILGVCWGNRGLVLELRDFHAELKAPNPLAPVAHQSVLDSTENRYIADCLLYIINDN